ncbi:MAG TPA: hypothetical protein VLD39_11390, partial [Gammaproteobacteria bacterium]|nr:hypothetical protein [Gammaproteobacteria bacterium]
MKHRAEIPGLALALIGSGLALHDTAAVAGDEDEIPFDVATIYFELNNTDGDLGIHSLIDGEPWRALEIETPREREILQIRLRDRLRRQGLTELFFESAEPPFESDDPEEVTLTPERFFRRFPEGIYEVSGLTLEGDELESAVMVTHLMPAPPQIFVNNLPVSEDCENPAPAVGMPFTISWLPVTESHPEIGRTGEPIELVRYELIVERPDDPPIPFKITVELGPDVTAFPFAADIVGGEPLKVEVLAREASGNQTATEA